MKKLLIGLWMATTASVVYASCSSHTYMADGKIVYCTTCCYGSNCTTTCY